MGRGAIHTDSGRLLVCGTPIGNLGDVTLRVLEALRGADAIQAEDTRVTRKLLARYEIVTPLERYDEHTAERRTPGLVARMAAGSVLALVSDAGMPGISDPGERLVRACLDAGLSVEVLPGPSAMTTALVASGLPTQSFYFGGFLPRKAGQRRRALAAVSGLDATLLFYESPRRTAATLSVLAESLAGRDAAVCRELTKLHEEVVRGTLASLAEEFASREPKGEVVIVVGPPRSVPSERPSADEVRDEVAHLMARGRTRKDAAREVSARTGLAAKEVYDLSLGSSR